MSSKIVSNQIPIYVGVAGSEHPTDLSQGISPATNSAATQRNPQVQPRRPTPTEFDALIVESIESAFQKLPEYDRQVLMDIFQDMADKHNDIRINKNSPGLGIKSAKELVGKLALWQMVGKGKLGDILWRLLR